jgi:hypothetical protein
VCAKSEKKKVSIKRFKKNHLLKNVDYMDENIFFRRLKIRIM